jgi:hypothetical protein
VLRNKTQQIDLIAAALTIVYGERPTSLIDGETCSAAWKQYDALRTAFVRKHRSLERLKRLIGVEAPKSLSQLSRYNPIADCPVIVKGRHDEVE